MDTTDNMSGKQKRKGKYYKPYLFMLDLLTLITIERNKAVRNLPTMNTQENNLGKFSIKEENLLLFNYPLFQIS